MSQRVDPHVESLVKELVTKLTHVKEDGELFKGLHKRAMTLLFKAGTMCTVTRNEIDDRVKGLSEKLNFHAFHRESQCLSDNYNKFMGKSNTEDQLLVKLDIMKLLFELSKSPTRYLTSLPVDDSHSKVNVPPSSEDINWPEYLKEGIEPFVLNISASSSDWSQSNDEDEINVSSTQLCDDLKDDPKEQSPDRSAVDLLCECEKRLKDNVQHSWFRRKVYRELPTSNHPEANVALNWEQHTLLASNGLLKPYLNIISEYKVVREIIWQLCGPHDSFVFTRKDKRVLVKEDTTISTLRPSVFRAFLGSIIKQIEMVDELRRFGDEVIRDWDNSPGSYKGYGNCLLSIVLDTQMKLARLEMIYREQESSITLLGFARELQGVMKEVQFAWRIHQEVLDYTQNNGVDCVVGLLALLEFHVATATQPAHLHVAMALYIEALIKYLSTIHWWFGKQKFMDPNEEFPVYWTNPRSQFDSSYDRFANNFDEETEFNGTVYHVRECSVAERKNPVVECIRESVPFLMKHIHLLYLLKRDHLLLDTWSSNNTLSVEFLEIVYARCRELRKCDRGESGEEIDLNINGEISRETVYKRESKYHTEMDKLGNLVNTDNPFLMAAFEKFFVAQSASSPPNPKPSEIEVFEVLKDLITVCVPIRFVISNSFVHVLIERFEKSPQILLDVFRNEYKLWEYFNFLQVVFLFKDNLTSTFYDKFFECFSDYDRYPTFYVTSKMNECLKQVHRTLWKKVTLKGPEDFYLKSDQVYNYCVQLTIDIECVWPFNVFVQPKHKKMYSELFNFILTIKWCLHVLVHALKFTGLHNHFHPLGVKAFLRKLYLLRSELLNVFTEINHYIFVYLLPPCLNTFKRRFDEARGFEDLVRGHDSFICNLHRHALQLRDYKVETRYSFTGAIHMVSKVARMWDNLDQVDDVELEDEMKTASRCRVNLNEAVHELKFLLKFID